MTASIPKIFEGLDLVRQSIDKLGIAKQREVTEGVKFKFRGIDDVMDVFSGLLMAAKVLPVPHYTSRIVTERVTAGGKANYNTMVEGTIEFVSLIDGSNLIAGPFFGEANDTADKSTAKAQSIAYRQGMLTTFVVPLGPSADPEADEEQQLEGAADAKPAKPAKAAKAASKPVAHPVGEDGIHLPSESMKRVLLTKAAAAGLETEAMLLAVHPSITPDNINTVLADLGKRAMSHA